MSTLSEFKAFIMRGNVIDLAVAVVIGAAFGKVVSSLVSAIIMPILGLLTDGINFSHLKVVLRAANPATKAPELAVTYGQFIQACIDFVIIAFAIFLLIKAFDHFKTKKPATPPAPPAPSAEEKLLTEIRDLLKARP
ncbi:MAG TPA: large-conductance mechanosensitive channel protein MscL [Nevskiaceae bacterium]|nr:large-conductance mechanosensitive channel protein MscL [Nevskiaceae bacterium]